MTELRDIIKKKKKDIAGMIQNKIDYIVNQLPFDNDYKIVYSITDWCLVLPVERNTEQLDSFVDLIIDNVQVGNQIAKPRIHMYLQDLKITFSPNEDYKTLDKYSKEFLRLAKESQFFKFPALSQGQTARLVLSDE